MLSTEDWVVGTHKEFRPVLKHSLKIYYERKNCRTRSTSVCTTWISNNNVCGMWTIWCRRNIHCSNRSKLPASLGTAELACLYLNTLWIVPAYGNIKNVAGIVKILAIATCCGNSNFHFERQNHSRNFLVLKIQKELWKKPSKQFIILWCFDGHRYYWYSILLSNYLGYHIHSRNMVWLQRIRAKTIPNWRRLVKLSW